MAKQQRIIIDMSTKGRTKIFSLWILPSILDLPTCVQCCSIFNHNSGSETVLQTCTVNLQGIKGRQGQSKNTGPVFMKQLGPITLDPTSKSTHPLSVKTRQKNSTHNNCKNEKQKKQMNVLDKLFVRHNAIVHFKAQHLEFIVENDYIL